MLLQEYYAKLACDENNLSNPKLIIDHRQGQTVINGKRYGIILPPSLINYCKSLWHERVQRFYFKGTINLRRDWVKNYQNVHQSNRGRDKNLKYVLDKEYYTSLGKTEFALTPTGECNWSYRMFEAIACGAIPVLGDNDTDIFSGDYKTYRHSDEKVYNIEDANHNYETLLQRIKL